jgi:hypothetical protein
MIGAVLVLALAPQTIDDPPECVITDAKVAPVLRFDAYPAKVWSGTPAKARQDTRFSRLFRTVLKNGAVKGPNFAGRFTIVEFGCGAACVNWAVVDARTGQVFDPPEAAPLSLLHTSTQGVLFRRDSRLLVLAGGPREGAAPEGVYSYLWTGAALKQIGFMPRAKACKPFDAP